MGAFLCESPPVLSFRGSKTEFCKKDTQRKMWHIKWMRWSDKKCVKFKLKRQHFHFYGFFGNSQSWNCVPWKNVTLDWQYIIASSAWKELKKGDRGAKNLIDIYCTMQLPYLYDPILLFGLSFVFVKMKMGKIVRSLWKVYVLNLFKFLK